MTIVSGNDLCEMLGLFNDLAEAANELSAKKIRELEKYKIAYTNRVIRDKKDKEEKLISKNPNPEDDEKVSIIRKQNAELVMQNARYEEQLKEITEKLDLLIAENDKKDKRINSLELVMPLVDAVVLSTIKSEE